MRMTQVHTCRGGVCHPLLGGEASVSDGALLHLMSLSCLVCVTGTVLVGNPVGWHRWAAHEAKLNWQVFYLPRRVC